MDETPNQVMSLIDQIGGNGVLTHALPGEKLIDVFDSVRAQTGWMYSIRSAIKLIENTMLALAGDTLASNGDF